MVLVTGDASPASLVAFNNRSARLRRRTIVRVSPREGDPIDGLESISVSSIDQFIDRWGRVAR
jgi:hypothetical protein